MIGVGFMATSQRRYGSNNDFMVSLRFTPYDSNVVLVRFSDEVIKN
jgi:hypothetical protein